ncbi:hypothetical protein AgCh_022218 [Apium graveolens]
MAEDSDFIHVLCFADEKTLKIGLIACLLFADLSADLSAESAISTTLFTSGIKSWDINVTLHRNKRGRKKWSVQDKIREIVRASSLSGRTKTATKKTIPGVIRRLDMDDTGEYDQHEGPTNGEDDIIEIEDMEDVSNNDDDMEKQHDEQ